MTELQTLGPYRLLKQLGQGGMGTVFEALDMETGAHVAVKVLLPNLAQNEALRDRFETEIDTLRSLDHPNIVKLFGFGSQDGTLFYSMEIIDGPSLQDELKKGRKFTWREVVQITVQICKSLKHAHDHGVVHRDIKPSNLMLDSQGTVKLADFGIARLFGNSGGTGEQILGSAQYMSPEQADGLAVTHRSDLYCVGGVMYALLAARPPFRGESVLELLRMHRTAAPEPLRTFNPAVPVELEGTISRLLSKDPQKRFANAMILARQLQSMEHGLLRRERLLAEDVAQQKPSGTIAVARPQGGIDQTATGDLSELAPQEEFRVADPGFSLGSGIEDAAPRDEYRAAESLAVAPEPTPPPPPPPKSHFTKVDRERKRYDGEPISWKAIALQLSACLAGMALIGGVVWYLTLPPTADVLYTRIMAGDAGDPASIVLLAGDVEQFKTLYPNDVRQRDIQRYSDEVELHKLERSFTARAKRAEFLDKSLSPLERGYLEAVSHADDDPEGAIQHLQTLIALFGPGVGSVSQTSGSAKRDDAKCLELARRRVQQLQEVVNRYAPDHRRELSARLDYAGLLAASQPAQARQIWQALVTIYAGKPWAADVVARARQKLAETAPVVEASADAGKP